METYYISKKNYYLATDLILHYPSFFKGCKNINSIITKKDRLPQTKFIFARKINDEWTKSKGNSKKFDKLFISKKWYDNNNVIEKIDETDEIDEIDEIPDLIHLADNEKFTDDKGNLINIEVCGEREYNKCYFRVKDIVNGFGLKKLHAMIINKTSGFIINVHYKYFLIVNKTKTSKKLYLTYNGLLKVLFGSRNKIAEKIVEWATETLFIAQMGCETQKQQLIADLIGVSCDAVKAVFNKTSHKIPCIYLFYISKVKNLRKSLNIDDKHNDNNYVCKWGMTIDLERRIKEHEKTYGKLKNVNLKLLLFGYIDPQYISEAETKIKHLFENMDFKLDSDKYNEIAIIPKNKMKVIKEQYEMISKVYMGHITELINKIKEKDNEILLLKKDQELQKEKYEKELQKEKYEKELLKKDLEIAQIKLTNHQKNK